MEVAAARALTAGWGRGKHSVSCMTLPVMFFCVNLHSVQGDLFIVQPVRPQKWLLSHCPKGHHKMVRAEGLFFSEARKR